MDQQPQIWIRSLKSLTDARYFAAMGINGISMEVNSESILTWFAIRDWVEGIQTGIEPLQYDDDFIARIYIDAKPDVLIVEESALSKFPGEIPTIVKDVSKQIYPHRSIRLYDQSLNLNELPHEDLLESDWTVDLIRKVLEQGYKGGFCFRGEAEEQTGIRDYTAMDEMLEILGR